MRIWRRLKRVSRVRLLLVLLTITGTALITGYVAYDEASRLSVSGTAIGLVEAHRTKNPFLLTYQITVRVGSWQTSVETQVNNPQFWLFIDGYSVGQIYQGDTRAFQPYQTVDYLLTFSESNAGTINLVADNQPHTYEILMTSIVSAGGYQASLDRNASALWSFAPGS